MLIPDLLLVAGTILVAFAVPSLAHALIEKRGPGASVWVCLLSLAILAGGMVMHPGGPRPGAIPEAFVHMVALIIN